MDENDSALARMREANRQMHADSEYYRLKREESDRRNKRSDFWLFRVFIPIMAVLLCSLFLAMAYITLPTIINAVIKATTQWRALL
jgi:hypothetical protein